MSACFVGFMDGPGWVSSVNFNLKFSPKLWDVVSLGGNPAELVLLQVTGTLWQGVG